MAKKKRGHFCIGCARYRPNEKFSGKGHRQHLCKDCKRNGKRSSDNLNDWDTIMESDEHFAFIVDYTESGIPIGITHEEWAEIEKYKKNHERVLIKVPKEVTSMLKNISMAHSLEQSIYHSLALTLFSANLISIQEASQICDCQVNDFISFLDKNHILWDIGDEDGHEDYQKSMEDLLEKIDQMVEQIDMS